VRPYVCSACLEEVERAFQIYIQPILEAERESKARQVYESTWRRPRVGEFIPASGVRQYLLVSPAWSFWDIKFCWRISQRICRGSHPAFVMIMKVDGALQGRRLDTCDSKQVRALDPDHGCTGSIQVDAIESGIAFLFARWAQRTLQPALQSINPDALWDARSPTSICECYGDELRVIQTRWIDGTAYVALRNFFTVGAVEAFFKSLGYHMIPRGATSVPPPATATPAQDSTTNQPKENL